MKITIVIDADNAAFEGTTCGPEVARILRKLADKVDTWPRSAFAVEPPRIPIRDINGNLVGSLTTEGE